MAGIAKGDRIVAIDGAPVTEWDELSSKIKESGGKPLNFQLRRGEETMNITVQPTQKEGQHDFRRAQRRLDHRHRQSSFHRKRQARPGGRQGVLPDLRILPNYVVGVL